MLETDRPSVLRQAIQAVRKLCHIKIAIGVDFVAKRAPRQAWHPPHVTCRERDLEPIRRGIVQSMDGIGPEVVILALFVCNDRGARCLELLDRVRNRIFIKGSNFGSE